MPETAPSSPESAPQANPDKPPKQWAWRPRLPGHWDWRPKLRWFAAEILIVVAGVLIALALNAWWQGRQDAASEVRYLRLLQRDLGQLHADLDEMLAFEARQVQDGVEAYRLLSMASRSPEEQRQVSNAMTHLTHRKTLSLSDATYRDLLSTGNLRLIHDPVLRDHVVSVYEKAGRLIEVHNRNNLTYVDEMFGATVVYNGLFTSRASSNLPLVSQPDSLHLTDFAGGYVEAPDYIWRLPEDSPEWVAVRGALVVRLQVARNSQAIGEAALGPVKDLERRLAATIQPQP